MLIYLVGAMTIHQTNGDFTKATLWRATAAKLLKHTKRVFDPCKNYFANREYKAKGVVNQNLTYLKKSDLVLLNLAELDKSPGSLFELFYCYMNHIPVIAFGSNYLYGTQPHVTESITMHFEALEEAIDYIFSMYGQEN